VITILHIAAALGIVIGAAFSLLASLGLVRFPDLYTRIHSASKAGVVGVGFTLISLAAASLDFQIALRSLAVILFLIVTTPISAHLLSRSTYLSGSRPAQITKTNELTD
jgi:multicomponent Na+:H+ antiporter subunit G